MLPLLFLSVLLSFFPSIVKSINFFSHFQNLAAVLRSGVEEGEDLGGEISKLDIASIPQALKTSMY